MALIGPTPDEPQPRQQEPNGGPPSRSSLRERLGALARLRVGLLDMPGMPPAPPPRRGGRAGSDSRR
jgi:hypothetical protein